MISRTAIATDNTMATKPLRILEDIHSSFGLNVSPLKRKGNIPASRNFLSKAPKAGVHLHLGGGQMFATVYRLLPSEDKDALRDTYRKALSVKEKNEFDKKSEIQKDEFLISVLKKTLSLKTGDLFHEKYAEVSRKIPMYEPRVVQEVVKDIAYDRMKNNYLIVSLRLNTRMGAHKNITSKQLVEAVMAGVAQAEEQAKSDGLKQTSLDCEIIASLPKFYDEDYGEKLAQDIIDLKNEGYPISGGDLAGPEVEFINKHNIFISKIIDHDFSAINNDEMDKLLGITAHVAEDRDDENVATQDMHNYLNIFNGKNEFMFKYGLVRVGHACNAKYDLDGDLLRRLIYQDIGVEALPISNICCPQTSKIQEIRESGLHIPVRPIDKTPYMEMLDAGVKIAVDTDDPLMESGTTMEDQFEVLGATPGEVKKMTMNAIKMAFISPERKKMRLSQAEKMFDDMEKNGIR